MSESGGEWGGGRDSYLKFEIESKFSQKFEN